MDEFLTATITGLATAGIFAIAASGLVLTYTTTGIFNFAHGAVGMLAAFAYWQLLDWGLPIWAAVALVLVVIAPGFGAAIERFIMRGLNNATETARLVVSVALLAASLALAMWIWPPDEARPLARFFVGKSVSIAGVPISWHEVLAFVLAVVVAIGLAILLRSTRTGITMRAVVDDRGLASLNGARPDRAATLAWALGCSLAALAGILLAPMQQLAHLPLTLLIVNAYAAAMLGRLRNLPLTFVGAVVLGLLDSYAFTYRPDEGVLGDLFLNFRPAIPVLVLFLVLVLLPSARLRTSAGMRRLAAPRPTWAGSVFMAVAIVAAGAVLAAGLSDADSLRAAKAVGLGLVALSLVPLVGWAGQMCLCQMSFAAIGAITVGHVGHGGNPWAIALGMVIAAVVGALVALPAVRLTGIELALATAAFAVILDRWIFSTPDIELLGFRLGSFDRDSLPLDRLTLPWVGQLSTGELLFAMTVAFALVHLLLVAVRRSTFGDRLLALRESPAACATLGLDPAATRLGVFSFSAGLAAFGGGLYASTLGSATPSAFDLFQSLPLLLVTVAGGVASSGGAIFAAVVLGAMPAVALTFTALSGVIGLLPGTMGITLGRNPDGIVSDLRHRTIAVWRSPVALAGVVAVEVVLTVLWLNGAISGWWGSIAVFLVPFVAARFVGGDALDLEDTGAATNDPLEALADIEGRPLSDADIVAIDRALGLDEVVVRA